MQRIFSAIARAFGQGIFTFGLIALIGISGLFIFTATPSLASTNNGQLVQNNSQNSRASHNTQTPQDREQAYDKATEAIQDPQGLDKIYEENLSEYEKSQPNKGIVKAAEDLVETVTGKK